MVSEPEATRAQLRITCADATMLLTDYDEGALAPSDHARLEAHLAGCLACGAYLDQLRATVEAIGYLRTSGADIHPDAMARLVEGYRRSKS